MSPIKFERAAVIGSGTMGNGIAQALSTAGVTVRVCDRDRTLAERARDAIAGRLERDDPLHAEETLVRIEAVDGLAAALDGASLVVECVPEDMDLKRDTWELIASAVAPEAVCSTNTSSFDVDEFARLLHDGSRMLGVHWFNPAYLVPCVEVVPAALTSAAVIDGVMEFLTDIGKRPVVVKNRPGFVGNRIQFAMIAEAFRCLADGVASAQSIDEVVKSSFGFRLGEYGVFEVADMGGLDVYRSILEYLEQQLGDRFSAPPLLSELVATGRLGMKSGAGVYEWGLEATEQAMAERDRRLRSRLGEPDVGASP